MAKNPPTYCRNAEEIAAAVGIKLLAQRNRRAQQLAEIRAWTKNEKLPPGAPPFPVAQRNGYWLRKEVVAWGATRAETGNRKPEKGNGKHRTPNIEHRTSNERDGELPPQPDAPAGELFESKAQQYQRRLDFLEDKFLNPQNYPESKIAKFEIDELRQNRPQIFAKLEPESESAKMGGGPATKNIGGGHRGVALYVRNNYPWISCNHMTVQRWVTGEYLPPGCRENFPPADASGHRWLRAEVDAWLTRYCPQSPQGQSLPLNIVELRDQAEKEEIEHQRWLREAERQATDKNYIRVDAMLGFAEEVGNAAFQAAYQTERERVRLFEHDAAVLAAPEDERNRWLATVRRLVPAESALVAGELRKALGALRERAGGESNQ